MEILDQTEKYRIQELEEQISSLKKKYEQTEADSKRYLGQVADLQSTLEEFQVKNSRREAAFNVATKKESEFSENLNALMGERKSLQETVNEYRVKINESENMLGLLRNELDFAQRKLESVENDIKAAQVRESEVMKKLKSAEDRLEQQSREIDEATTRNKDLEDILLKVENLVATVEELRPKCSVLEKESEALAQVNLKLNQELVNHGLKISGLQETLSALEAEKDKTAEELQASNKTIEDLTYELTSEGERLKSHIFSLEKENDLVNQIYHCAKNELQSVIVKLEEELSAEKSKADSLVSEIKKLSAVAAEKSVLESRYEEVEARLIEEVNNAVVSAAEKALLNEQALQLQKELQESQAFIAKQNETLTQKQSILETCLKKSQKLESRVKERGQKVKLADAKSKDNSGDKNKSKAFQLSSSGSNVNVVATQAAETSQFMTAKASQSYYLGNNVATEAVETSHLTTGTIVVGVVIAFVVIIVGIFFRKNSNPQRPLHTVV